MGPNMGYLSFPLGNIKSVPLLMKNYLYNIYPLNKVQLREKEKTGTGICGVTPSKYPPCVLA